MINAKDFQEESPGSIYITKNFSLRKIVTLQGRKLYRNWVIPEFDARNAKSSTQIRDVITLDGE